MRIHAAMMTQLELTDLIANVTRLLPFVDSVTIVDGGSTDLTIPYMRNWSRRESKIRFFIHPWRDNFPEQRNNYLSRVREIASDGDWVVAVDPDEFIDTASLARLRDMAAGAGEYRRIGIRCRSVTMAGPDRIHSNEDQYWKGLFYRWSNDLRYTHDGEGAVHERLVGADPTMQSDLVYEHVKQEGAIWYRGVRNYFCGGGGPNLGSQNPRWCEMKAIAAGLGIATWHQMHAYLIAGQIDASLRDWIIKYRRETGWDGASEQREWFKTYFRFYHPEEEPPEFQGEHIE